jgi:hypothetical protein
MLFRRSVTGKGKSKGQEGKLSASDISLNANASQLDDMQAIRSTMARSTSAVANSTANNEIRASKHGPTRVRDVMPYSLRSEVASVTQETTRRAQQEISLAEGADMIWSGICTA